jgi:transcriptional regulator with XRE-family HTH domain
MKHQGAAMKSKTMKQVAAMLRKARANQGLSLREAARRSGLSVAQLSKLEAGKTENPTMVTIVRASPVYGIEAADWF